MADFNSMREFVKRKFRTAAVAKMTADKRESFKKELRRVQGQNVLIRVKGKTSRLVDFK